jgi:hypothetical protein
MKRRAHGGEVAINEQVVAQSSDGGVRIRGEDGPSVLIKRSCRSPR